MSKTKDAAIDAMNDTVPVTFHVPRPPDGWEIPNPMRAPKKGESFLYARGIPSLSGMVLRWSEPSVSNYDHDSPIDIFAYPKVDRNQADWYDRLDAMGLKDCWVAQEDLPIESYLYCFDDQPIVHKSGYWYSTGLRIIKNIFKNPPIWHGDWRASPTQVVNGKAVRP